MPDRANGSIIRLIKEINWSVKGTEKFWNDLGGANSIFAMKAASLCDDDRIDKFLSTPMSCIRLRVHVCFEVVFWVVWLYDGAMFDSSASYVCHTPAVRCCRFR